ncbi:MAG: ABC transporter ATP-binding protein/permease [Candidatus Margulisbacteria bacterium]|nr:ABC transporter ATP-binding protein/permease [Candidatus Margulisiibacteriota bacterium]
MKLYARLIIYIKPYWRHIIGSLIAMVLVSIANVLIVPLIGTLSDAIGSKDFQLLNLVIAAAFGIYFLRGIATYAQIYLMSFAGQRVVTDIRKQVFSHLQSLSLDFFSKWRVGEVISRSTNDIENIQHALITSVTEIFPSMITLLGVLGYLLYLNWRLTLMTLLIVPVLSLIVTRFGEQMRNASRHAQRKIADISAILQETVSGARVVKSFAMEKDEIEKFHNESEQSFWLIMKQWQINATQMPLLAFIQLLAVLAVIWYGGFEVISGRLAPSNLIAFFAGIALISDPVSKLGQINVTLQKALASAERIFELIDLEPTIKDAPDAIELPRIKGNVEFKDVSFKYEKDQQEVLKDINFNAGAGKIVALVGKSGAGKSTFINLLPRFYDPTKGTVAIDGLDIKKVKLESLRSQLGIVPQETMLFSGTVKDNIRYGKKDASPQEIEHVSKIAHAHEFIKDLPRGYDTLVGERGVLLSGGQRQRVAIARALLKDPRILVFDEATSSLDTESERLVQDAMQKLMEGRTTFVIAHRISTVQHADIIIVLDRGMIVETGKHDQLLQKGGIYKRLYDMQFKDEENPISK